MRTTSCSVKIRSHHSGGDERDITGQVLSINRMKSMLRPAGGFQVRIKPSSADTMWVNRYVREGDAIDIDFARSDGIVSPMMGYVDSVDPFSGLDPASGLWTTHVGLSGQDWMKAMLTEVRVGAQVSASTVNWMDPHLDLPKTGNDEEDNRSEEELLAIGGDERIIRDIIGEFPTIHRMPGIVAEGDWTEMVRLADDAVGQARADLHLRKILAIMLWGLFVDPNPNKGTILQKLSWERWGERFDGRRGVDGAPWQIQQLASQNSLTPFRFLQSYGNPAWNEIFGEYDRKRQRPALIFRERPFSDTVWRRIPMCDLGDSQIDSYSFSRSGDERFNYWRPISILAGLYGVDQLIDSDEGKLPLIDIQSIRRYGFRAAEPADNYNPPLANEELTQLGWNRERILRFRRWFVNAAEMYTGMIRVVPGCPSVRIGDRLRIPKPASFRLYTGQTVDVDSIVGYVVEVQDTMVRDPKTDLQRTSTTIKFIRGQPEIGLPVPPAKSWMEL